MPLVPQTEIRSAPRMDVADQMPLQQVPDAPEAPEVSWGEAFGAAWERESVAGAAFDLIGEYTAGTEDPMFNPYSHMSGYEQYEEELAGADNLTQMNVMKANIDKKLEAAATLTAAGGKGIATSVITGLFDPALLPFLLVPGGALVRAGQVGRSAAGLAGLAGVEAAVAEGVLSAADPTRTRLESVFNVTGAVLLGGILGGTYGRFAQSSQTRKAYEDSVKAFEDDINEAPIKGASGGAAAVATDALAPIGGWVTRQLAKMNPIGRTATSQVRETQEMATQLAESVVRYRDPKTGEEVAINQAAETKMKRLIDANEGLAIQTTRAGWRAYKKGGGELSKREFREQVGMALDENVPVDVPEVKAVAQAIKNQIYNPIFDAAAELGVLNRYFDELAQAETGPAYKNYLTGVKIYNQNFPQNQISPISRKQFNNVVAEEVRTKRPGYKTPELKEKVVIDEPMRKALDDLTAKVEANKKRYVNRVWDQDALRLREAEFKAILTRWMREGEKGDVSEAVNEVFDKLTGHSRGAPMWAEDISKEVYESSPMMARTINIPNRLVKDFIIKDVESLTSSYVRALGPRMEMAEMSLTRGDTDSWKLKANYDAIDEGYNREVAALQAKGQNAKAAKLRARQDQDKADIQAMQQRLLGVFDLPTDPTNAITKVSKIAKTLQYLSMMGGMTISAIPDMARPVFAMGLRNTYGKAAVNIGSVIKNWNGSLAELQKFGDALDMMNSTRMKAIADLEGTPPLSRMEHAIDKTTHGFSVAAGMSPWNTFWKGMTGMMGQDFVLRNIRKLAKGQRISKGDKSELLSLGIDERVARQIFAEADNWNTESSLWLAATDGWKDRQAALAYQAAITKMTRTAIITPGVGDVPRMIKGDLRKLMVQFKSFAFAATNRMMLASTQQIALGHLRAYNALAMSVALGTMVYATKMKLNGKGDEISDDPLKLLEEGIDRSGWMGILMEIDNMADLATQGNVSIGGAMDMIRGEDAGIRSRQQFRGAPYMIGGPTMSTIDGLFKASGMAFKDEISESEVRAVRRLFPFQNLFWLDYMMDSVESAAGDAVGAKESRR